MEQNKSDVYDICQSLRYLRRFQPALGDEPMVTVPFADGFMTLHFLIPGGLILKLYKDRELTCFESGFIASCDRSKQSDDDIEISGPYHSEQEMHQSAVS